MTKKFTIILFFLFSVSFLVAQSFEDFVKQEKANYTQHVNRYHKELKELRDKQNAEYADMLRGEWTKSDASEAQKQPARPEPPKPKIAEPEQQPKGDEMPVGEIVSKPKEEPKQELKPTVPVEDKPKAEPKKNLFAFEFYGTKCEVDFDKSNVFYLKSVDENGVADAWLKLSDDSYTPLISDCLLLRKELDLSDWGYVKFVEILSSKIFEQSKTNEAKVFQMYVLTQSGYEARIARTGDKLVLLLPFTSTLYEYPYLNIEGGKYYVIDKNKKSSYFVFNKKFPNEQRLSLQLAKEPRLSQTITKQRILSSKRYKDFEVNVKINKNLIDFYNDFPRSDNWSVYSKASLSEEVKQAIYPVMKSKIAGKSQKDAVDIILNFVQTSLDYQTDDEQFGYERPLFADESLFYPYSDCEDRSILFSVLVRELVGLEVAFLEYPNHLATAVKFSEDVKGDYLMVGGEKFVICDPTYIGAGVGLAMPDFKNVQVGVIRI
ncbi:MAG: hypothetical protein R3Y38_00655 [Rikenellaceae bacterium]